MIKNGKVTIGFIIASISLEYLINISHQSSLAEILGAAFGLILWPFIITWAIKLINQLLKRQFDEESFFWTFLVICGYFGLTMPVISVQMVPLYKIM
jgi:Kef-type K+ transport system membrane component KefB